MGVHYKVNYSSSFLNSGRRKRGDRIRSRTLGRGLIRGGLDSNLDRRLGFARGRKVDSALGAEPKG